MKTKLFILLVIISILYISHCSSNLADVKKEPCKTMPNNNVVNAIQSNCLSCHEIFKSKKEICIRKTVIINAVANGRMPKIGSISDQDKEAIVNWK